MPVIDIRVAGLCIRFVRGELRFNFLIGVSSLSFKEKRDFGVFVLKRFTKGDEVFLPSRDLPFPVFIAKRAKESNVERGVICTCFFMVDLSRDDDCLVCGV